MAMSQKAQEVAIQLLEDLRARWKGLTGLAVNGLTYDTDGGALIVVGGIATGAGGLFKIMPYPWPLPTNSIGQAQPVYTPTVIMLCTEAPPTSQTPFTFDTMIAEALKCNTLFQHYVRPNGTFPVPAEFTPARLNFQFDHLRYPLQLTT